MKKNGKKLIVSLLFTLVLIAGTVSIAFARPISASIALNKVDATANTATYSFKWSGYPTVSRFEVAVYSDPGGYDQILGSAYGDISGSSGSVSRQTIEFYTFVSLQKGTQVYARLYLYDTQNNQIFDGDGYIISKIITIR